MKGRAIFVRLDLKDEIEAVSKATGASQRYLADLARDAVLDLVDSKLKGQLLSLYRKVLDQKLAQMTIPEARP